MDTAISVRSNLTKVSIQSQDTIDNVSMKSQLKLYKLQANIDEDIINNSWSGFGMYITKSLRQGRAISIPKFGLFTYSFRDVNLDGTTNEYERDKEVREPVFIVSKDFAKGLDLKSSVYRQGGIVRPLVLSSTSGKIQQTLCSYQEIASITNLQKENVKYSVERIIRRLEDQIRNGEESVYMMIPSVGLFMYKKGLVCVKFQDFIKKDIKGLLKLNVNERRSKNKSDLTADKLKGLSQTLRNFNNVKESDGMEQHQLMGRIDEDAKDYLKDKLNIDADEIIEEKTPKNDDEIASKLQMILTSNTNDTIKFNTLRDTYSKQTKTQNVIQSEEEIIFEKLKFILRNKSVKPYDVMKLFNINYCCHINYSIKNKLFSHMLGYIYGLNSTDRKTLNLEQFKKALHKYDIEFEDEQEYISLFTHIDSKRDNFIDLDEWTQAFNKKESKSLEYLKDIIMRNNIVIDDFFKTMGLNRDQEVITLEEFKQGLKRINISKYHSDLATAEIFQEQKSIPPQIIIDKLTADRKNLKNFNRNQLTSRSSQSADVDDSDTSLLLQIYRKIKQELVNKYPEEKGDKHDKYLIQEFEKLDQKSQGSLDIANFKTCLMKANLHLTLNEVVRIARYIEKNEKGQVDYCKFSKKVNNSQRMNDEIESLPYLVEMIKKYMKQNKMNSEGLIAHLIENKENRKTFNIQDKKKVRIPIFAQIIGKKIQFDLAESVIQQNCELIDIDRDGYIDKYDLETFLNRYYYIEEHLQQKPSITSQIFSKSHSGQFFSQNKTATVNSTLQSKESLSNHLLNVTKSQLTSSTRLYPIDTLPLEKLEVILRDLKSHAAQRRLSYYEIFKILDTNNDGFIDFSEFEDKIEQFMKLSSNAKEGLFAYFDHLKIGMFDFPRFASILSRITLTNNDDKHIDNWNWQHEIIKQIKSWKIQNGFSEEEAFRIVDCDFDGFISKDDLKKFLTKEFKMKEDQIDTTKLDRLFKLFDQYKKGYIQKHDFSKIFTSQYDDLVANGLASKSDSFQDASFYKTPQDQLSKSVSNLKLFSQTPKSVPNTHVKELSKTLTFLKPKKTMFNGNTLKIEDWMINCCQQIALVVSSNFKNLTESFEEISNHSNKIEFQKLNDWIIKSNALHGFNLTGSLMQKLFAYMDPHKKGYLTQDDWISCFQIYVESKDIPLSDLTDLIYFSFSTNEEAFKFFLFGQKMEKKEGENKNIHEGGEITLHKFKFALNNLFKQVYSEKVIEKLWLSIHSFLKISVESNLTLDHFCKLFPRIKSLSTRYNRTGSKMKLRVANIDELRFTEQFKSNSLSSNNLLSYNKFSLHDDIINKFKNLVLSKGKDILAIFKSYDKNDCGYISNCEFKNILMRLNIGLNGRDMDYILIFADPSSPAQVNWKNFMKKLQFSQFINECKSQSQQQLINRSKKRLQHLKECLYSYLISPKDAFREFDEEKKGIMTLEDFRYFLVKIAKLDRSDIPSFAISKDMFDQIDLKRDGLIDLDEWLQAFMNYGGTEEHEKITQDKEKDKIIFNQFHKQKLDLFVSQSDMKKRLRQSKDNNSTEQNMSQGSTGYQVSRSSSTNRINGLMQNVNDVFKNSSSIPLTWEKSQDYDKAISLIARNRKFLLEKFDSLYEQQNGKAKSSIGLDKYLCTESVKQILWEFLTSHNINPSESNISVFYNFASQKNGQINYNFMIDVFKNRLNQQNNPPKNQLK